MRSIERLRGRPHSSDYSFSVTFSATESVRRKMLNEFLTCLQGMHRLVEESDDQEVFQMNFDLFAWSAQR